MSKKQNYYQVHKNKKSKKRVSKKLHPKVTRCIQLAMHIVETAIKRHQMLISFSQPKFRKEINDVSLVGGVINRTDNLEPIVDKLGNILGQIDKYKVLTESVKNKINLTSISSEELTKKNNEFLEIMKNISVSQNKIFN